MKLLSDQLTLLGETLTSSSRLLVNIHTQIEEINNDYRALLHQAVEEEMVNFRKRLAAEEAKSKERYTPRHNPWKTGREGKPSVPALAVGESVSQGEQPKEMEELAPAKPKREDVDKLVNLAKNTRINEAVTDIEDLIQTKHVATLDVEEIVTDRLKNTYQTKLKALIYQYFSSDVIKDGQGKITFIESNKSVNPPPYAFVHYRNNLLTAKTEDVFNKYPVSFFTNTENGALQFLFTVNDNLRMFLDAIDREPKLYAIYKHASDQPCQVDLKTFAQCQDDINVALEALVSYE